MCVVVYNFHHRFTLACAVSVARVHVYCDVDVPPVASRKHTNLIWVALTLLTIRAL